MASNKKVEENRPLLKFTVTKLSRLRLHWSGARPTQEILEVVEVVEGMMRGFLYHASEWYIILAVVAWQL